MIKRTYDNWDELVAGANKRMASILKTEVAPVAEDILKRHIKTDIYDAYTPKTNGWVNHQTYQRRHSVDRNVTSMLQDANTLVVTSRATASKPVVKGWVFANKYVGSFLYLIEKGKTGIWRKGFPRPAVANTQEAFGRSKAIESAIKRGIVREFGDGT